MSSRGDDLIAEWGNTTTAEDLAAIRKRFEDLRAKGFTPFRSRTAARVQSFGPEIDEDIIFIAPLIGG
jgi:hypothetical protein